MKRLTTSLATKSLGVNKNNKRLTYNKNNRATF